MVKVNSWGRLAEGDHELLVLSDRSRVARQLQINKSGLAYGAGRSYGDSCLNPGGVLWLTSGLDRFIHFDPNSGRLQCEAGVLLGDIQRSLMPRGWMLPVTPGSQFVTVGGAIANDVHGKNHHAQGCFGDHVQQIWLHRTDGSEIVCSPDLHAQWFAATVGGLGLTGVISQAELQLRRVPGPWLTTETIPFADVDEFCLLACESEHDWEHTVSWIDCLSPHGHGLFMRANACDPGPRIEPAGRGFRVPLTPPFSVVNKLTLKPFNSLYYHVKKRQPASRLCHYQPFFYPLDRLLEWNRLYGPRGFYQYQSVVPMVDGPDAVRAMLHEIAKSGEGSVLAVLKTFGNRSAAGLMSFAQPGLTLALDFPNRGASTLKLLARLDAVVRAAQGRIYPAKDARMPRELFEAGYPKLNQFLKYRDPGISSALSRRLMGS